MPPSVNSQYRKICSRLSPSSFHLTLYRVKMILLQHSENPYDFHKVVCTGRSREWQSILRLTVLKFWGIKYLITHSKSNQNGLQDHNLLKSALRNELRYSEHERYTCMKHPNSCSDKTYTQDIPILTYIWQPPNKMLLLVQQKGYLSSSFPLFLAFSSCSLTLLHVI